MFFYPVIASLTFTHAYFVAQDRFNTKVCKYFVNKYLDEAIANGFKDYEISKS